MKPQDTLQNGRRFSLSLRERAGVRGNETIFDLGRNPTPRGRFARGSVTLALVALSALLAGCGMGSAQKPEKKQFFTSGSREADQRASQRMAKEEQLTGSGEGVGEKNVKKAKPAAGSATGETGTNIGAQAEGKLALFDRLGGEQGLARIVDDFLPRATQDPRVNWQRKDVKHGGILHHDESAMWSASPEQIAALKKHFVQFFALATGGPAHYDGTGMKAAHAGMRISNPEFDAVIGDLKATLDRLQIPNKEQKELLSVVESTRPEIVTER